MLQLFILLLRSALAEEPQKYPENTADISSINNLAYKPPISLDPKIRKALLNVLNRLEEQERTGNQPKSAEATSTYKYQQQPTEITTPENVKWEYKTNDTFKEYDYFEALQNVPTKTTPVNEVRTGPTSVTTEQPGALFFQVPSQGKPIEKQENLHLQETKNSLTPELLYNEFETNEEKTIPRTVSNSTEKKSETKENEVEVFAAPLLTAFTLEQDERGLPRRLIRLDTSELSSLLEGKVAAAPSNSNEIRKAREQQSTRVPDAVPHYFPSEQKRYQLDFESQYQELQERKRQLELERQHFYEEQEKARRLKYSLEQRQKEDYFRTLKQNEIPRQEISLQKSVPLNLFEKPVILQPFPSFPLYKPQVPFPDSVDRQLQNLFQRSGIIQGKQQEDFNIVSKVLALNYGEEERPKTSPPERLNTITNYRSEKQTGNNVLLSEKDYVTA